jgi:hypothetical protein
MKCKLGTYISIGIKSGWLRQCTKCGTIWLAGSKYAVLCKNCNIWWQKQTNTEIINNYTKKEARTCGH